MVSRGHFETYLERERSAQNESTLDVPDWPHSRMSPPQQHRPPHCLGGVMQSDMEVGISPKPSLLLPSQESPASSPSALLYMNADFEGGEFIFTEMDAKTVTVSQCCEPNTVPQQPVLGLWPSPGSLWLLPCKESLQNPAGGDARTFSALLRGCDEWETCRSEGWLRVLPARRTAELPPHLVAKHEVMPPNICSVWPRAGHGGGHQWLRHKLRPLLGAVCEAGHPLHGWTEHLAPCWGSEIW